VNRRSAALELDGVGHDVAQEAPDPPVDRLLEALTGHQLRFLCGRPTVSMGGTGQPHGWADDRGNLSTQPSVRANATAGGG
jgi:hypothetical protein